MMAARGSNGSGARDPLLYEEVPMSKDRRKFIIVSVFDFILTTLLWLLSTVSERRDCVGAYGRGGVVLISHCAPAVICYL